MSTRRKRRKKAHPDAAALQQVLLAMITAIGHGGLTMIAEQLGMTPSALRKRLLRPGGGFDAATMLATSFVMASKSANMGDIIAHKRIGDTVVTVHPNGDGVTYGWIATSELDGGTRE